MFLCFNLSPSRLSFANLIASSTHFRGESAESPVVLDLLPDFRDILRPDVLGVTFAGMTVAQLVVGAPT